MHTPTRSARILILLLVCIAAIVMRIFLASRGHNFDMESWTIVADLAIRGENVYAHTYRHPYGPPWFLILGELRLLHDMLGMGRLGAESFHMLVAGFLSLADVGLAILLYRAFGIVPALFMLLNPVSMLITGYHSQIDNLAILPALGAWLLLVPRPDLPTRRALPPGTLLASAALLGLSLSIKHVLAFFPIWLLMCPQIIGRFWRRALYAAVAYAVVVLIVLPFVLEPLAWTGFRKYVLGYEGLAANRTLLSQGIDLFAPPGAVDSLFGLLPEGVSILKRLFLILMLLMGWIASRRRAGELLFIYLLALVVFTHSMADQYLAVPIVACAVYWRRWPAWVYLLPAALLIYWPSAQAGAFPAPAPRWHAYGGHLAYPHAQIWLAILLATVLIRPNRAPRGAS